MKLLIESIEGGTYLATVMDNEEKKLVRDNTDKPKTFHSLSEIKTHFNRSKFEEVWLKQSTPYDEMCGLDEKHEKLEMLIDWH